MVKGKTIDSFFKRKDVDSLSLNTTTQSTPEHNVATFIPEKPPSKSPRIEPEQVDIASLVRDPGLRPQMWDYPTNQRDEIRRAYLKVGPYQCILQQYPYSGPENHRRRFQASWFNKFHWLEYSPSKDAAFCHPCYLFAKKSVGPHGSDAFTVKGFQNWKKVNNGKDCAFLTHVGTDPNSPHNIAVQSCEDLKNQSQHIEKVMYKQTSQQITNNRLRLKASIDSIRWLTFQGCAFRGHDESSSSKNRGNFIEMIKMLASYNEQVRGLVLEKAPQNAKYISPTIQKEILHVLSSNVQAVIRDEIGDEKFCLIVDEARDVSKREKMAVVLRFVDKEGFVRERFIGLVHVRDTIASTLKEAISVILSRYNLSIQNLRGQGYDGASNMRGEWNGLQALFLNDNPYAYYVHCFAHRLQLALVAASREVIPVHQFFSKLTFIINIIGASCKRNDELKSTYEAEIANLIANDEITTGRGLNQIGTLQRAGDTRWGSHFNSICSIIRMFNSTCSVLSHIMESGSTYLQRGDASSAYESILSFEFVFILHLMKEIMGITDILCQALQQKSQDILNAMNLVSTTKSLIQKLRDDGWDPFIAVVKSFCERHDIEIPDMSACFFKGRGRCRTQQNNVTVQHHYQIDVFTAAIDSQLQELNSRFSEQTMELLILSSALDPKDSYRLFNAEHIYSLVDKFYPSDFTEQEKIHLKFQLQHYEFDITHHPNMKNMLTLVDLCQELVKTGKSKVYYLIDRLIRLVLTLPVSTASSERAFSAMSIVKTQLRNKMEDDFLADYLIVYIEKEIAEKIPVDKIIDDFYSMKERRAQLN